MEALRVRLSDGRELAVRGYAIDGEQVTLVPVSGEPVAVALAQVDLAGTFAANASAAAGAAPAAEAPLELLGLAEQERGEYRVVEGLVRNRSGQELRSLVARVIGRDAAGAFVTSEEVLVDGSPLPPGAESPFRVVLRSGGRVRATELSFRELAGAPLEARPAAAPSAPPGA